MCSQIISETGVSICINANAQKHIVKKTQISFVIICYHYQMLFYFCQNERNICESFFKSVGNLDSSMSRGGWSYYAGRVRQKFSTFRKLLGGTVTYGCPGLLYAEGELCIFSI